MNDADILAHLNSFITENKLTLFDRIAPQRTRHVTVVLEDIYQSHNASAVLAHLRPGRRAGHPCDRGTGTDTR